MPFEQFALGHRLPLSFLRIEPGVYLAVYFDGLANSEGKIIHLTFKLLEALRCDSSTDKD